MLSFTAVIHTSVDSSPAVDSDGTIYVTGAGQYLQAVNPDGSPKWAFDTSNLVSGDDFGSSSPCVGPDHTVYVGSQNRLYAINNGALRWAFPDPRLTSATVDFESSPVLDIAGAVYAGGMDSNFYAIQSNGFPIGVSTAQGSIKSSAVIGTNNIIFFASTDGIVHVAAKSTNGLATNAPWPIFHKDSRHTGFQPSGPTLAHACGAPFPYIDDLGTNDGFSSSGVFQFLLRWGAGHNVWEVFHSSTNYSLMLD